MIKFIATDMDGTLLNSKKELSPEFYDVFEELKKRDILFAAASGRQYYTLAKEFNDIKDDMLFIAENGTFVVYKGKELVVNGLDREFGISSVGAEGGSLCSRLICPAVTPSTSRASSTSTTTTRSRAPSEALALIFRPLTPVRLGANPSRFTSQAAARIRAIMAMSAPLTCSSGAAETGAEDCTVAWLFITNGSGGAFAQTE